VIVQALGCPGEPKARLEALLVAVVQRSAVAVLSGEKLFAGGQVIARLAILDFDVGSHVLVAQPQVQGQIVADLEIVLPEEALPDTTLPPSDRKRFADVVGKTQ